MSDCSWMLIESRVLQDDIHGQQFAQKLKVFKLIFSKVGEDPVKGLSMVDAVQRLGIDYHFQDEIQQILQRQFMIFSSHSGPNHNDLCDVALRFRLLRQHGYYVPAGVYIIYFSLPNFFD